MSKMPFVKSNTVCWSKFTSPYWRHDQAAAFAAFQIHAGAVAKFQRPGETQAYFQKSVILAGNAHFLRIKAGVEFGKCGFQRQRIHRHFAVQFAQDWRNNNFLAGFACQVKIGSLVQPGADAVFAPLMTYQPVARHDIQSVAGKIIWYTLRLVATAISGPVAAIELWPKSMDNECK